MPKPHRTTAALLIVAGACAPNPVISAPEPARVKTPRAVADVVSIASRVLADAGFEISAIDGQAGVLTAKRSRPRDENAEFLSCEKNIGGTGRTSAATGTLQSTVTISVNARRESDSTSVRTNGQVDARWTFMNTSQPVKCVSSGVAERRVIEAIGAT